MSIFGNLHKDTASAAFVIPLHELAERLYEQVRTAFVQFAVAHIAQMWHELCSCRQAARILAIFVHFVISRLDLKRECEAFVREALPLSANEVCAPCEREPALA
jgi:hypothetical protein